MAQTPSYFVLGESEFDGVDIYDIHQDKNNLYWIATNNGVYTYDGIRFLSLSVPKSKGRSFFNLIENNEGVIFNNLSGQFYLGTKDTIIPYFQIPDRLVSPDINAVVNDQNELIVSSGEIFKVNQDKSIQTIFPVSAPITKGNDGIYFCIDSKHYGIIKGESLEKHEVKSEGSYNNLLLVNFKDQMLFVDKTKSEIRAIEGDSLSLKYRGNFVSSIVSSSSHHIWITNNSTGVELLDESLNWITQGNSVFQNSFISSQFEDNEGNIWLGTFGEGLFYIPNIHIRTLDGIQKEDKIREIATDGKRNLFLGALNSKIYNLTPQFELFEILQTNVKSIDFLEYMQSSNELIYDLESVTFRNLKNGTERKQNIGAAKDIYAIGGEEYLIATNMNVQLFNEKNFSFNLVPGFKGRFYCVGYDAKNNIVYGGSSVGLKLGKMGSEPNYFQLDDQDVFAIDIININDITYIATQKKGVLLFEGIELIAQWNLENNLPTNQINRIQAYDGKFVLSTDVGLLILNNEGEVTHHVNTSEGLFANNIIDFEILNGVIYVVHQKGIQFFSINNLNNTVWKPNVDIIQTTIDQNEVTEQNAFPTKTTNLQFHLSPPPFKFRDEVGYYYRLYPLEKEWQPRSTVDYRVIYKSLPPGEYTFEAFTTFKRMSSEVKSFDFKVLQPFYLRWWFIVLIVTVIIATTVLIYNYQVRRQLRKAKVLNEINASKLTAIQSQMNPHFIFNALNSIQDLVLQGDVDNSYTYITKFANLVRKTLKYSDKEFIPIEDEINLLKLYLNIEKLRFKEQFNFTISADDIEDILVPPMLIQPFVENALVHGLLHKQGEKNLDITFKINDRLTCTVTDNGIGREKAMEIKTRQKGTNESFSVNAIKRRFDILNGTHGSNIGFDYEDLKEGEKAVGTKVTLYIPIQRLY